MDTQNKYISIVLHMNILEYATGCLLILVDSWMVLRAYPREGEVHRSRKY